MKKNAESNNDTGAAAPQTGPASVSVNRGLVLPKINALSSTPMNTARDNGKENLEQQEISSALPPLPPLFSQYSGSWAKAPLTATAPVSAAAAPQSKPIDTGEKGKPKAKK